jgi:hypothetical protein
MPLSAGCTPSRPPYSFGSRVSSLVSDNFLISFCGCRYEHQEIALNCGTMLRECARYEALAKIMLYADDFFNFFRYVEVSTFDIASDAFSTFKVCAYDITK